MYIDDLFQSPAAHVAAFAKAQVDLYRADQTLQDYFLPLQGSWLKHTKSPFPARPAYRELLIRSALGMERATGADGALRRKIKADVLLCPMPYFSRRTENEFMARILLGLANTGATVLCLLPHNAPCRADWQARLTAIGRDRQVTFLDPSVPLNRTRSRLRQLAGRMRARSAFAAVRGILGSQGPGPGAGSGVEYDFEHTAYFVEIWERLAPYLEFDAVVARCHWHSLCSPVCRTALQRGKPVITFQQGVIGHSLDAPVMASKYVAFGEPSASFLGRMNRGFFQAAGKPEPAVEYINGGCLYDSLALLPDQFENQTVLLVDVPGGQSDFYGTESQCHALLELAGRLLSAKLPLRRLIIRPHPYWSDLDFKECQDLIRQHRTRCDLSHPVWSLEDDLKRSSAVAGIFSGVLTVAAACGLPTVFLETDGGYGSGDLACFSPEQILRPDAAFQKLSNILLDREAYGEARAQALRSGREYYANGDNLELDAGFFEKHLQRRP